MALRRIPFDAVCLAAIAREVAEWIGARVQDIRQPNPHTVTLELYSHGREACLLLSADPQWARVHFISRRPRNAPEMPAFCGALRSRVDGARLSDVRQVGLDRILELEFVGKEGTFVLAAETMGTRSNLILREGRGVVAAAKVVGTGKSARPVVPGRPYALPPSTAERSLLEVKEGEPLDAVEGASPFLVREWIPAYGLKAVQTALVEGEFAPVLVPGYGAYPLPVAALGYVEHPRESLSAALESYVARAIPEAEAAALRHSLLSQLRRVLDARETALRDLRAAEQAGLGASVPQLYGELILAYGPAAPAGATSLDAFDYQGEPIQIPLNPELDWRANADRYFSKAKKAKGRLGLVRDQIARMEEEHAALLNLIERAGAEERLDRLQDLNEEARARRWLNRPSVAQLKKEERPYAGHRIREVLGPNGAAILYGENAESNDYLTLRVAKPNDWWLHVRGHTSAHVIVPTRNQPDRIPHEVLLFAAKIAVQHSPLKHSGFVPVDLTLRKYVRKPKGTPSGTASYTHERTLHVEG